MPVLADVHRGSRARESMPLGLGADGVASRVEDVNSLRRTCLRRRRRLLLLLLRRRRALAAVVLQPAVEPLPGSAVNAEKWPEKRRKTD